MIVRKILLSLALLSISSVSLAKTEKVKFSEGELATETVLPVFREKVAVKNRNVILKKRFGFSANAGSTLNDAMFDIISIGGGFNYHFSDKNSVYLDFIIHNVSESKFVSTIENAGGTVSNDFSNVSKLSSQYTANWEYEPYYGKLSFSKSLVFNMSTYVYAGGGMINFTDTSSALFQGGIGQKVFFSKNWGLRLDLRGMFYQQPNIVKQANQVSPETVEEATFNLMLTAGVVFLFPTL